MAIQSEWSVSKQIHSFNWERAFARFFLCYLIPASFWIHNLDILDHRSLIEAEPFASKRFSLLAGKDNSDTNNCDLGIIVWRAIKCITKLHPIISTLGRCQLIRCWIIYVLSHQIFLIARYILQAETADTPQAIMIGCNIPLLINPRHLPILEWSNPGVDSFSPQWPWNNALCIVKVFALTAPRVKGHTGLH
jgi:hypothetical protein